MSLLWFCVFFCKQKTAYEMRISDWSSDVCSSDLEGDFVELKLHLGAVLSNRFPHRRDAPLDGRRAEGHGASEAQTRAVASVAYGEDHIAHAGPLDGDRKSVE